MADKPFEIEITDMTKGSRIKFESQEAQAVVDNNTGRDQIK